MVIWRTKAKRNVIKTSSVEKTVKTVFYYVCSYISHSFLFAMKKKKIKSPYLSRISYTKQLSRKNSLFFFMIFGCDTFLSTEWFLYQCLFLWTLISTVSSIQQSIQIFCNGIYVVIIVQFNMKSSVFRPGFRSTNCAYW